MRDYKFRAFDKVKKKMVFIGFHIIGETTVFDLIKQYQIEHFNDLIIMQYTGLNDATKWEELTEDERSEFTRGGWLPSEWKGKEIYESDIVKEISTKEIGVIYWAPPHYVVSDKESKYYFLGKGIAYTEKENQLKDTVIIGNLHSNPELLKEGNK